MGFLWRNARFRIVGSETSTSFASDALLLVEGEHLRLRFVNDRGQLFLDLQPSSPGSSTDWYSIDLLRRLMSGRPEASAVLDESYADFLRENFDAVSDLFSDRWSTTQAELRELKAKRAKEMFG